MTDESSYISALPQQVRVKVVGAVDVIPLLTLNDDEAAEYGLLEAMNKAYEKISALEYLLKRFPKDYTFLQPTPEVITMNKNDVVKLIKFIKDRTKIDLYKTSVTLMYRSKTFLLSIEYPCG